MNKSFRNTPENVALVYSIKKVKNKVQSLSNNNSAILKDRM